MASEWMNRKIFSSAAVITLRNIGNVHLWHFNHITKSHGLSKLLSHKFSAGQEEAAVLAGRKKKKETQLEQMVTVPGALRLPVQAETCSRKANNKIANSKPPPHLFAPFLKINPAQWNPSNQFHWAWWSESFAETGMKTRTKIVRAGTLQSGRVPINARNPRILISPFLRRSLNIGTCHK